MEKLTILNLLPVVSKILLFSNKKIFTLCSIPWILMEMESYPKNNSNKHFKVSIHFI